MDLTQGMQSVARARNNLHPMWKLRMLEHPTAQTLVLNLQQSRLPYQSHRWHLLLGLVLQKPVREAMNILRIIRGLTCME